MAETDLGIELKDTLYGLQRIREDFGHDGELDVILGEIYTGCSVFRDLKTENRIVITRLPDDEDEFAGALVSITNPAGDIPFTVGGLLVSRPELVIGVDAELSTWQQYSDDNERDSRPIAIPDVLKLIQFPQVRPIPVSEYDPREAPNVGSVFQGSEPSNNFPGSAEFQEESARSYFGRLMATTDQDILSIPKCNTYTLLSDLYDKAVEKDPDTWLIKMRGFIPSVKHGILEYDMTLLETPLDQGRVRISDFDRDFIVSVTMEQPVTLELRMAKGGITTITSNEFFFQVIREGCALKLRQTFTDRNKQTRTGTMSYLPTQGSQQFLDQLLIKAKPARN